MELGGASDSLQLGELLHKFFYAEPRKLYRNLRIFPFPFAFENDSLSIFRMSNALAAAKTGFAGRLGNRDLRAWKLLTTGCKKLRNVVDGAASGAARRFGSCAGFVGSDILRTLIFVFIAPVPIAITVARGAVRVGACGLRRVSSPGI